MVKTFAQVIYGELRIGGLISHYFNESMTPQENRDTLNKIVSNLNITKSEIIEIERSYPGTSLHLEYMLQSNNGVDFGICDFFKVWHNHSGWQYGCFLDKGKGRRIQVACYGALPACVRKEEREIYLKETI